MTILSRRKPKPPPTNFIDGWGRMLRGSEVIHWFQASVRGNVASLCRRATEKPQYVAEPLEGKGTICRLCIRVIAASGSDNPMLMSKDPSTGQPYLATHLRWRYSSFVKEFLEDPDPARGPGFYVCAVCKQAFEGVIPTGKPYLCSGTESEPHNPVEVIELARKDKV